MRPRLPIAVGDCFERLTVRHPGPRARNGEFQWWCECSCGRCCVLLAGSRLKSGKTRSCGCLHKEVAGNHWRRHGTSKTPEHKCWCAIRQRCQNPNDSAYSHYGGRGIRVCARWQVFENFLADMGLRPSPTHSIERLDVNGDYEPGNCLWAAPDIQARNKTTSLWINHNGERLHIKDWAVRTGIAYGTLRSRLICQGWSIERALTEPVATKKARPFGRA